jgi:hypothetical protein
MYRKLSSLVLVAVFSLLASSVFAEERSLVLANDAPTSALSVFGTDKRFSVIVPNINTPGGRKHIALRSGPFAATIDYVAGEGAISRVFDWLPSGSTIEYKVVQPNGTVVLHTTETVNILEMPNMVWVSSNIVGKPWNGPLPTDWPSGITDFQTIVTKNGKSQVAHHQVPVNTSESPLNPLDSVVVDAAQGIMLKFSGGFETPQLVVSSYQVGLLELSGGNYIPPGAIPLPANITSCSWLPGERTSTYCGTKPAKPLPTSN